MRIEHNGQVLTGTLQDGYWTFLIQTDGADDVKLLPDEDCTGQTEFTDIQLEYGTERTTFEAPTVTTGDLTGLFKDVDDLLFEVTDPETGLKSRLFQLGGAWAIQNLTGNGDIISQINLIEDMARIQARFIHLNGTSLIDDAVIKSAHIESMTADKLTAGTIDASEINVINLNANSITTGDLKGISISGSKLTTTSSNGFNIELNNGQMKFNRAILTMGTMNATLDATTLQPNGFAITQYPGQMFNIASLYNDGSTTSSPVIQIPATSEGASKKLNIYAQGGLYIDSDSFDLNSTDAAFNVPLVLMGGLRASHAFNNTVINDAGNLMYSVDKDNNGVMFHRLGIRTKSGTWVNSRFEFYEDGRLARVVNGVRTFY